MRPMACERSVLPQSEVVDAQPAWSNDGGSPFRGIYSR
jgi:hypothetical protein